MPSPIIRLDEPWPTVEFTAETKAMVYDRHRRLAGGSGPPVCWCCGEPVMGPPDFHHRKGQRRGGWAGDGRPSNCLLAHSRFEGEQCHHRMIHEDVAAARAKGWIILKSAPPAAYRMPLMVAAALPGLDPDLPWVVLLDRPTTPAGRLWRQATRLEVAGDYGAGS